MNCSHCRGAERVFDEGQVEDWLRDYSHGGPSQATERLLRALQRAGCEGRSLLDIGGGVGVIPFELFGHGLASATLVEASQAAVRSAQEAAQARGLNDRMQVLHGDFVELASDLPSADLVTLDRVICCYPDMPRLVGYASAQAGRAFGAVYPRDTWWVRLALKFANLWFFIQRNPFRVYVHSPAAIDAVVRGNGFARTLVEKAGMWEITVYQRAHDVAGASESEAPEGRVA